MFDEALRYLLSLGHETLAIKLGLSNTERLLTALNQPQNDFPSVQIAGTNGKGSTAAMLASICRAAQIKTGLYTSPHLVRITERIRINEREISEEEFASLTTAVHRRAQALVDAGELETLPTFFEHLTAIAFLAFSRARVQLAILETGLGGRLDATTTARAGIVAITPIALDHQEYLGETLDEIAAEKAAIIRPGVEAIIAPQEPAALDVILKRSIDCGVTPRVAECEVKILGADEGGRVRATFKTKRRSYESVLLGLRGRHQTINAAVAISLAEALIERGFDISRAAIIEGLEKSVHPGRLDLYLGEEGRPAVLFDGAHNAAGARALRLYLDEFIAAPVTTLFGAMRDKELAVIAAELFPAASQLILTAPSNARAATVEMLARVMPAGFDTNRLQLIPSPVAALSAAYAVTPPAGVICITGSLYLIGELMGEMKLKR